jgi:DNA-binding beta-propeller fold protein YncE
MERRNRRRRILVVGFVVLILAAVVALYVTAPPPTILLVRVLDDSSGEPLAGAQVQVQQPGQPPMPAAVTDETGSARFDHPHADPAYRIRVQKPDYGFALQTDVAVPQSQETEVAVRLVPQPGGRLLVGLVRARLAEIDTASLLLLHTLILPAAPDAPVRHVRVHPDGSRLYVVAGARALILSAGGGLLAEIDVGGTVDSLDVSRDGAYLLLTGTGRGDASTIISQRHVWTVDAHSGELLDDSLLSRRQPPAGEGIVWQPDGTDAYLLQLASPEVQDMPARGQTALGLSQVPTAATRSPSKAILSPDGQYLYTWRQGWFSPDTGRYSDVLLLISTEDGTSVYQEMRRGVSALALSPAGDELYALNDRLGTLTIVSLTGSRPQTVIPVGKEPQAVTVSADGRWAYVANGAGQAITIVDLTSATVWHTIPLSSEPLSLAVR